MYYISAVLLYHFLWLLLHFCGALAFSGRQQDGTRMVFFLLILATWWAGWCWDGCGMKQNRHPSQTGITIPVDLRHPSGSDRHPELFLERKNCKKARTILVYHPDI